MPLLRLSRLYQDTAKNLCAGASPVARVPATPSGAYDLLFSGVSAFGRPARFVRPGRSCGMSRGAPSGRKPDPTFSVGKTRGALSPPQQPISALQPPVSNLQPLEPPVTGRRSRAAGRPSPYARFSMLAPTSWLSTLELSTFDCQLPMASQLLTVWRLFFSLSPLQSALTQKCGCKSFAIRSYKSLDLKSPGMTLLQKIPGVGGVCLLQTQDLSRIFHCQAGPVVRGRGKYLS